MPHRYFLFFHGRNGSYTTISPFRGVFCSVLIFSWWVINHYLARFTLPHPTPIPVSRNVLILSGGENKLNLQALLKTITCRFPLIVSVSHHMLPPKNFNFFKFKFRHFGHRCSRADTDVSVSLWSVGTEIAHGADCWWMVFGIRADVNVPKKIKTGADSEAPLSPSLTAGAASGLKFRSPDVWSEC